MIGTALRSTALAVLVCILIASSVFSGAQFSSATFTTQSTNGASTASAAVDWTPPTVAVTDPRAVLKGAVTLTATASDAETGIATVVMQVQVGGTWTTLCTTTAVPHRCSWNTTTVADSQYDVRAIATDNAGYSATSAFVRVTVANAFSIVMADPGEVLTGSVSLEASLLNANLLGLYTMRFEYAVAGTGVWKSIPGCVKLLGASECTTTWSTASIPGGSYDLRATASPTLNPSAVVYSVVYTDVTIDNAAPTVSMTDPGSPLRGTVTLSASAADADSGIASVAMQYAATGSSTWTTACTATQAPHSCRFATTALARGTYSFRAVATDLAGLSTISATIAPRAVDNTVSSVSLIDPATHFSGTETVAADAGSTAGVTSVSVQYAAAGSAGWMPICRTTHAPYACEWNTTTVADGLYDLRAVLVDGTGAQTISAIAPGRRVDNAPVRGIDVQTANGAGTAGRVDAGDRITFTYSAQMATASILPGWNGSATAVTLRLRDGALTGTGGAGDTVDVLSGSTPVGLGAVNLRGDYIKPNKTSLFAATMTAETVMVNGSPVTAVTVTVGALMSGGALRTVSAATTMTWTPSASATSLSGASCSSAPVRETGAADREF